MSLSAASPVPALLMSLIGAARRGHRQPAPHAHQRCDRATGCLEPRDGVHPSPRLPRAPPLVLGVSGHRERRLLVHPLLGLVATHAQPRGTQETPVRVVNHQPSLRVVEDTSGYCLEKKSPFPWSL